MWFGDFIGMGGAVGPTTASAVSTAAAGRLDGSSGVSVVAVPRRQCVVTCAARLGGLEAALTVARRRALRLICGAMPVLSSLVSGVRSVASVVGGVTRSGSVDAIHDGSSPGARGLGCAGPPR